MSGIKFTGSLLDFIKNGEGSIDHMYLDTVGKVTVGVGNMLPKLATAQALSFLHRNDNKPATHQQIEGEFTLVSSQQAGKNASSYKIYTKLYLPITTIDALLEKRITEFTMGLKVNFPDYDQYPESARMALMDMIFNLGNAGLVNKFPSLTRAVKTRDWQECARQCNRVGIADSRNAKTKTLFLHAADN